VDGLLVVDKIAGLTSHDVVAAIRRILREPRVGHTGTLDPAATGVLPLVVGRATRLARFVSGSDKSYVATIALGIATDTADASGVPLGTPYAGPWPSREVIDAALEAFRGTFLQQPPVYSAKKVDGRRSYAVARQGGADPVDGRRPEPVRVTVHRAQIVAGPSTPLPGTGPGVTVEIDCSAGFYVRSLAHDLGERLGTGAHLARLRRTGAGIYTLDDAISLDDAVRDPQSVERHLVPMAQMLTNLPAVVLTPDGMQMTAHGQNLGPRALRDSQPGGTESLTPGRGESLIADAKSLFVRLFSPAGELVGIAERMEPSGALHPSVVLM